MQISLKLAIGMSIFFALFCLGFAVSGFVSARELTDAHEISDAIGFAWFWSFLAAIAVACGIVSWWAMKTVDD